MTNICHINMTNMTENITSTYKCCDFMTFIPSSLKVKSDSETFQEDYSFIS